MRQPNVLNISRPARGEGTICAPSGTAEFETMILAPPNMVSTAGEVFTCRRHHGGIPLIGALSRPVTR
jgi:hypothetical protein